MRHLLTEIRDIADPAFPVDQAGTRVTLALRRFDDRRPIMVGDVVEAKRNAMAGQDVPDRDAEVRPRKLYEGEHETYMTEAKRDSKVTRKQRRLRRLPFRRRTESTIAC
jgi:hypothetical protein